MCRPAAERRRQIRTDWIPSGFFAFAIESGLSGWNSFNGQDGQNGSKARLLENIQARLAKLGTTCR